MKPLLFFFICIQTFYLNAQDFDLPSKHFSSKQLSTFVLKDSTELKAYLIEIQKSKGLISGFEIKLENNEKQTLNAKDLRSAQLIPNQLEKAKG